MLKVRYMSDLHIEFHAGKPELFTIPTHENDADTVLLLAGDIGTANSRHIYGYIGEQSIRFKRVLMIMGNHEHYGGDLLDTYLDISAICSKYPKLELLENETRVIDKVAFIGSSLWADFNCEDSIVMNEAYNRMNDYRIITYGGERLTPRNTLDIHYHSVNFIFDAIRHFREEGNKVVVFTHHGPSYHSVAGIYTRDLLNGCYVSDLEEEILATNPDYWIHGHTHHSFDYNIGNTRVLVNPRGYYHCEINPIFNQDAYIEL